MSASSNSNDGPAHPLELSEREMRDLVAQAADRVIDHVVSLPEQRASYTGDGRELARSLREELPRTGTPVSELLQTIFEHAVPCSYNTASPGYLAYIPGGGLVHSAVADLIGGAVNRYVGVWVAAPGLVQLEANVIRWFADIIGYPEGSGGMLTTGGSLANLIAVITARRERLPENFLDGTLYVSDQTHHSVQKAAVLAGFPPRNVRVVPSRSDFTMQMDVLQEMIADDRRAEKTPFCVVASAGTTNSGAVDDLGAIADVAAREGLWSHCDAAYGGFFALTARGRRVLVGLERMDSVTLDPHKGLFLPYGNGSLLVRDAAALRRAHSTFADYMPPMQSDADLVDYCQVSPELSRDFRGLRAWLPLKMHGIDVFRDALDEKLDLAEWITNQLRRLPHIEIVAAPQLTVVAFRLAPADRDPAELDQLNRRFLDAINARGRVYLNGTRLRDSFVLRICVLSFRTHEDRIAVCLDDIAAAADLVLPASQVRG